MAIQRYIPSIGNANWDIKSLNKEERTNIKKRLVCGITHSEEEYQAVISYLHMKYPDLMDNNPDGMNLQWNYAPHKNKTFVKNSKTGESFDMYAFAIYDPERDMEPISFGGSYFKAHRPDEDEDPKFIRPDGTIVWGHGYVLFVDPDYRRMGIASDQWLMESQLYRDCNVKYQYDIQNEASLKVTQSLFKDPNSCKIVAQGRLKQDGTRAGIRILMNYFDQELIDGFNNLEPNMKDFYKPFDWTFLKREGLTIKDLIQPWQDK